MTNMQMIQNEYEWHVRGQIDLSAAAAVTANRGTNQVAAKTAAGTYTVTIKGNHGLKLVELLDARANFCLGAAAGALGVRVQSVTQTSGTDDIVITLKTTAQATSGADTDVSGAVTVSFQVVMRVGKMTNPLA